MSDKTLLSFEGDEALFFFEPIIEMHDLKSHVAACYHKAHACARTHPLQVRSYMSKIGQGMGCEIIYVQDRSRRWVVRSYMSKIGLGDRL
jgi:hypothetical protein